MIVDVARRAEVAGIVATNTTTARAGLLTAAERVASYGPGGLSGAPLRTRSTEVVRNLFRLSRGSLTIVGVGGVFTADDVRSKFAAGANLVQVYTSFIYEGPMLAKRLANAC